MQRQTFPRTLYTNSSYPRPSLIGTPTRPPPSDRSITVATATQSGTPRADINEPSPTDHSQVVASSTHHNPVSSIPRMLHSKHPVMHEPPDHPSCRFKNRVLLTPPATLFPSPPLPKIFIPYSIVTYTRSPIPEVSPMLHGVAFGCIAGICTIYPQYSPRPQRSPLYHTFTKQSRRHCIFTFQASARQPGKMGTPQSGRIWTCIGDVTDKDNRK